MLILLFRILAVQGLLLGLLTLVLLAAAGRLQKRYGPRWLCRLWLVLAVCYLIPVQLLMPRFSAPVQISVPQALSEPLQFSVAVVTAEPALLPVNTGTSSAGGAFSVPSVSPVQLLAALWCVGILAVLLWQMGGYFVWRQRVLHHTVPAAPAWQQALQDLAPKHNPQFLASSLVHTPMVMGVIRPVLLVPAGPAPRGCTYMLTHELTHLARRDIPFKLLLAFVCAVHWYNPAVWLLSSRVNRDIESACDADVLQGQGSAYRAAYADALLSAAAQSHGIAFTSCFALSKRRFKQRLAALWDTAPKRRGIAALCIAAVLALAPGGMVACRAGAAPSVPADTSDLPAADTVSAAVQAVQEQLNDSSVVCHSTPTAVAVSAADHIGDIQAMDSLRDNADPNAQSLQQLVEDGQAVPVLVTYYCEYQPELRYVGFPYKDGWTSDLYVVPQDGTEPVQILHGIEADAPADAQTGAEEEHQMAADIGITVNQLRMARHQARALQTAGLYRFDTVQQLTLQEQYRYLVAREKDFGWDAFAHADTLLEISSANMILTVDFTTRDDWSSNAEFFTASSESFTQQDREACLAEMAANTADSRANGTMAMWQFSHTPGSNTLTVTISGDADTAVQHYTFLLYGGSYDFDDRTVLVSGERQEA